ncbi:MAG TPA: DUF1684 domain-containing protein [Vicinamibacterales bacterium]|jgi:uncharacterized protein (DUF1684 family)|nr:DUF1684 domain-containing protein [Vicinamibacterales bacterium]
MLRSFGSRRHTRAATLVCALTIFACRASEAPGDVVERERLDASVAEWRRKHEADYRRDWVSVAGLHALKPGGNTAGSAPGNDIVLPKPTPARLGVFHLADGRVRFEPSSDALVLLKNSPVTGVVDLSDDSQRGAEELVIGEVRLVVHVSGETRSIRVRDPNGPLARAFRGFAWFPVDARYRVAGRFIKDAQPRRLKVVNTYGDIDEYTTEGVVEFELLGRAQRLRPFTTRPGRLYFVFRDGSSGIETYETARFLYADLQSDGTTVLDFNTSYNPPCAFNPFTTCPIPLRENRLDVKILAGEKAHAD